MTTINPINLKTPSKRLHSRFFHQGYFSTNHKKLIFSSYLLLKPTFNQQLGRKCKTPLLEQLLITLFKLRYNLPDRVLEDLFSIDHATISRIIIRITTLLSQHHIKPNISKSNITSDFYYCVDSTTLRIGKGRNKKTYSGYKHHHGVKFQVLINNQNQIEHTSIPYSSSIHDKKVFLKEYDSLIQRIKQNATILGDKGYSGLSDFNVVIPIKRNELKYKHNKTQSKSDNKLLSSKRIKIEHVFAQLKSFRILHRLNYYSIEKINILFHSIVNLYNLSQMIKN